MKLLIIFIVLNICNVILQTVKSICTVKCGKTVAAIVNAVAFGLYTVVIVFTNTDLPLMQKVLVVALSNLIGVYVVKWVEDAKKSNEEIGCEVIAGKWGNGDDRKNRLRQAGYNYNVIQSLVNTMLIPTSRKSNEEIAHEVIAGKWGNGYERKTRLKKAGYDYTAIQSIVNRLMK